MRLSKTGKFPALPSAVSLLTCALTAARRAGARDEVPIGAALWWPGGRIVTAGNRVMARRDPTAHAEIELLRKVIRQSGGIRLPEGAVLAVTVEPCLMCLAALTHARLSALHYGCAEPKWGSSARFQKLFAAKKFNHAFPIGGGILAEESAALLKNYFKTKRGRAINTKNSLL